MDKNSNNQDKQKKIVSMNSAMQNLKSMVAKNKTTSSEQPTATIVYNKPTSKIDEDMQKLSQDISTKEIVTEIEESTESVKKEAKSIEEKPAKTVDNSEFAPKILDDTNEYDDIKKVYSMDLHGCRKRRRRYQQNIVKYRKHIWKRNVFFRTG